MRRFSKLNEGGGLDCALNFTCSSAHGHPPDFGAVSKTHYITLQNARDVGERILSGLRY